MNNNTKLGDLKIEKFIIIPAKIARDPKVTPSAKILFGEILCLSKSTGECYASNSYLAKLCKSSKVTISKLIKILIENEYITTEILHSKDLKICKRVIKISLPNDKENDNIPHKDLDNGGIKEKFMHNNIKTNKISTKRRQAPTIEEIENFINLNDLNVNATKFFNYYNATNFSYNGYDINYQKKLFEWHDREKLIFTKPEKHDENMSDWEKEILEDMQKGNFA